MTKTIFKKVMWLGRATTFLVGLAVILALTVGLATTALAGTGVGARFQLGQTNTVNAITKLVGSVAGPSLQIDNNSTGAGATALDLQVEAGKAPMKVNSATQVANLNADKVDGRDAPLWADINIDATTARGFGVTSSQKEPSSISSYHVTFNRNVGSCAYVATVGSAQGVTAPGEVSATPRGNTNTMLVQTFDSSGVPSPRSFHLAVFC